jgi:4-amino-4-deoxy-L-arabinose transferase-like glycosyltransferase
MLDSLFAIGLATLVLFLSAGLGSLLTKPFKLDDWSFVEQTVIGVPLGLAAIAYGVFFMGLAGLIKPLHLILWLTVIGAISIRKSITILEDTICELRNFRQTWNDFSIIKKVIFSAGALALLLALFQAFTPPWDYDGLAYHLQGPRLFLEAGKILPIPENWFTFYPFTWEMIYLLGMGLGSDIFARLIHFSTLILLLLATYAIGKRFLPKPGGWVAAAILLGIPILPLWGNAAYTDIAWALFQFLAIALFLIWENQRKSRLLVLAGVMQGLALGSKYLALSGAGILLVFIIWFSIKVESGKNGWKSFHWNGLIFGLSTLIIALPWYLKNYIWTGNPVFPLYFPQNIIDPNQLSIWMDYVNSFGTGKAWYDYLLLPVNLFLQHEKFGSFMGSMEMASPLFLFVFVYPWARKRIEETFRKTLDILSLLTFAQFVAWAFGSQQTRFLLPAFPGLSILASAVIVQIYKGNKNTLLSRSVVIGSIGGMVAATLVYMGLYINLVQPQNVIFGYETKTDFLKRNIRDFEGINYINNNLTSDEKILFLWDGRGYYCNGRCIPDIDQSNWIVLTEQYPDVESMANHLQKEQITHLFLSIEDASFFLLKHDETGVNKKALEFLVKELIPNCGNLVHKDNWSQVFELDFDKINCQ